MSEWISIDDSLPKKGQLVDVYDIMHGRIPNVRYTENGSWCSEAYRWSGQLSHWMHIPEPPKDIL